MLGFDWMWVAFLPFNYPSFDFFSLASVISRRGHSFFFFFNKKNLICRCEQSRYTRRGYGSSRSSQFGRSNERFGDVVQCKVYSVPSIFPSRNTFDLIGYLFVQCRTSERRYPQHDHSYHAPVWRWPSNCRGHGREHVQASDRPLQRRASELTFLGSKHRPRCRYLRWRSSQLDRRLPTLVVRERAIFRQIWKTSESHTCRGSSF